MTEPVPPTGVGPPEGSGGGAAAPQEGSQAAARSTTAVAGSGSAAKNESGQAAVEEPPPEKGDKVKDEIMALMAGPMPNRDPIFVFIFVLTIIVIIMSGFAIFIKNWFIVYDHAANKEFQFGIFDSSACGTFKHSNKSIDTHYKQFICQGSMKIKKINYVLWGKWIFLVVICSCGGFGLACLTFLLQIVNLVMPKRSLALHNACASILGVAGCLLVIGGHIAHHVAVWNRATFIEGYIYVQVDSLGSGLMMAAPMFCAWGCVFFHVSSHAPGPVCPKTRFLHTFDKPTAAPPDGTMLQTEVVKHEVPDKAEPPAPSLSIGTLEAVAPHLFFGADGSVHSTEV